MSTNLKESWYERITRIKEQLIYCATGDSYNGPLDYESLRLEWLKHPTLKNKIPGEIKQARNLSEFRVISQQVGGYKERRAFIREMLDELLSDLEAEEQSPSDELVSGKLSIVDSDHIKEAWTKALERRATDPDGAITSSRTILETVCKHILSESGENPDASSDLPKLYSMTAQKLNLSPAQHTEPIFKQVLGGCHSVIEGLGALRNRHSDAHGKAPKALKPSARHAELAVNLAGSMAIFLLSTWEFRKEQDAKKQSP
jgi:hypothetical protein